MNRRTALPVLIAAVGFATASAGTAIAHHATFSDVPAGSTHETGITWLADRGITGGCGGDRYCPESPVTRGQMATFMRRLAGADPNVKPSVDASTLGGLRAEQLRPRFYTDYFSVRVLPGKTASIQASCQDGDIVMGGGYRPHAMEAVTPNDLHVIADGPVILEGTFETGAWEYAAENKNQNGVAYDIGVTVICFARHNP